VVTRPHGVHGQVRLHLFNPESLLVIELESISLRAPDGSIREVRIEAARDQGDVLVVSLESVQTREAAEELRGCELCVRRGDLPPEEDGDVYHVDVVGLVARSPSGTVLGTVREVIRYPAADCFVLETDRGTLEVPWLEPYLVELDVSQGTLVLD